MSINIKIGADISSVDAAINDVSKSLNGLKTPVKNASFAINSLSQVARDLPFGFIAIQNNLPLVVDSFGQLTREAGGTIPALKSLGQSLIGPAGIGLAFSAVTSIVTFAIQKYGSLGNAIDAIFSKNSELAASQQLFNKELAKSIGDTQTEIEKINILSKTLNDSKKSRDDRYAAYVELRKISPDIVAGIKEENALTQKSIEIINRNTEARKQYLILRAKESAITAVINKNAADQFALEQERPKLLAKEKSLQDQVNASKKKGYDGERTFQGVVTTTEINLASASKAVIENQKQIDNLTEVNKKYVAQLVPTITGISQYDGATQKLNNSLKTETKELTATQIAAAALLELYKGLAEITRGQAIQLDTKSLEKIKSKQLDLTPKIDFAKTIDVNQITGIKIVTQKLLENSQIAIDKVNADMQEKFKRTAEIINGVLFQPLENLFTNLIETGKFAFKDFVNAILQQLTRLIAKLTAAAIIAGILAVLTGGGSTAGGAASGGASAFGTIFKSLSGLGGIANPGFGGIQPGGINMGGQVNLVLRGQDLVGSLNRTNSQFSRVG